ncbi:D-alanyl-D-alanine carboxypeptidase family protein [Spiribacter halobius]|uniref:serine-type D-Ala-D-Ala carboxypeptidase n=1 Tax=Sediminicurvatus halobius TaxID=2182432 RepID=A0A2U2N7R7_9GAMM|nr:D-alanyl-D-alanine carboxypeptidase family protein [Spiribacter halobius]PWG65241.1 serine-type D-Ala-D-Ala carboxypeptidase [Spiribacter halobius]UEX78803.1 D-alanyl-D-alanine carboxypeptidase [Spiribacter halobius]
MQAFRFLILLVFLLLGGAATAQTQPIPVPSPPQLGAESYLLLDFHSGRVLVDHQSDLRRDPASLTKIMTAFIVFSELRAGNLAMDDEVLVSERAWRTGGSRMFIEVGDRVTVENLLRGMIIQSGNDASVALAEHIAGTEETFAELMNQYAAELGMENTNYTNAAGLPGEEHYSSAEDTALLVRALIQRFPELYQLYSERSFTWNGIEQFNRNRMLWRDASVDGVKTGYTESAGYCLATSAQRENMRLISVVMGAASPSARIEQSQALLNYGFRFFETHRLYAAGEPLTEARVWKGASDRLGVGLTEDLYVTIPARQYDNLDASLSLDSRIDAPVDEGTVLGSVSVRLGESTLAETRLVALEAVPEGGLWSRLVDEVLLWFE